ncbi:BrnT family toxin [Pigmentiphaga aceris]|uniref:BrnT family toxin n=1 Tax=Pigmentiphaga aceris TaxID=1940612 RepID=A0A5C0AXQ8_9BURK|nr:BrnT family toxin [Pigmentiphaga aceris]QEI07158.1 BrnT family toxin [Pigmentiphaga aceris]
MQFEWDETKNQLNIRKHGIDFQDVPDMFSHPVLTMIDNRFDYDEVRWVAVGWLRTWIAVVVYTERDGDSYRVISARKATRQEANLYVKSIEN